MSKKRSAKAKSSRSVRNLPAKPMTAKEARTVQGGKSSPVLMQACATGVHIPKGKITI